VQLEALSEADLARILSEPEHAIVKQQQALLATEGIELSFTPEAIAELARIAAELNRSAENIGARRLITVVERVMDEISFTAPERGHGPLAVDADDVRRTLAPLLGKEDLARYIL